MSQEKRLVFDYCELDKEGGCVGCAGDGQGDCAAKMKEVCVDIDQPTKEEQDQLYTLFKQQNEKK